MKLAFALIALLLLAACGTSTSGIGSAITGDEPPTALWAQTGCVDATGCKVLAAERAAKAYGGDGSEERGETWCIVAEMRGKRTLGFVTQRAGFWRRFIASTGGFTEMGCPKAAEAAQA